MGVTSGAPTVCSAKSEGAQRNLAPSKAGFKDQQRNLSRPSVKGSLVPTGEILREATHGLNRRKP